MLVSQSVEETQPPPKKQQQQQQKTTGRKIITMTQAVRAKVSNMFSNRCDPFKLHCDPLGFQQPSLHAKSDPAKLQRVNNTGLRSRTISWQHSSVAASSPQVRQPGFPTGVHGMLVNALHCKARG